MGGNRRQSEKNAGVGSLVGPSLPLHVIWGVASSEPSFHSCQVSSTCADLAGLWQGLDAE